MHLLLLPVGAAAAAAGWCCCCCCCFAASLLLLRRSFAVAIPGLGFAGKMAPALSPPPGPPVLIGFCSRCFFGGGWHAFTFPLLGVIRQCQKCRFQADLCKERDPCLEHSSACFQLPELPVFFHLFLQLAERRNTSPVCFPL